MLTYQILAGMVALLVVLGVWETIRHRRNVAKIPIRIHVNGTRGKSSVTRLIAAGLREGGIPTCAKTTGTLARVILPDGRELPVYRPSKANIIEQVRIMGVAAAYNVKALVIECMALVPEYQWLCERKFVHATHGVITNARADHLDVMGPEEEDVAEALCGMMPLRARFYTAERRWLSLMEQAARDRGSEMIAVGEADVGAVTAEEMAPFRYWEHEENVALALRVCADLGVERTVALSGMYRAQPDPGAMTEHELQFFGKSIVFVNGFAANDPESSEKIWSMALKKYAHLKRKVLVFNCRADRPDRSIQLGEVYPSWPQADTVVLMGEGTYIFAHAATEAGLDSSKIVFAEDHRTDEIFELIVAQVGRSGLAMGLGNIGGQGLELVSHFRNREIPKGEA